MMIVMRPQNTIRYREEHPKMFEVRALSFYPYWFARRQTAEDTWIGSFMTSTETMMLGEIKQWCTDQFGPAEDGAWGITRGRVVFADPTHAIAFKLRWC